MNTPLSRAEFERLLHSGHGRAALHVQRFGLAGIADLVLDAEEEIRQAVRAAISRSGSDGGISLG